MHTVLRVRRAVKLVTNLKTTRMSRIYCLLTSCTFAFVAVGPSGQLNHPTVGAWGREMSAGQEAVAVICLREGNRRSVAVLAN